MSGSSYHGIYDEVFLDEDIANKICDEFNNKDYSYLDAQDGRPHYYVKKLKLNYEINLDTIKPHKINYSL